MSSTNFNRYSDETRTVFRNQGLSNFLTLLVKHIAPGVGLKLNFSISNVDASAPAFICFEYPYYIQLNIAQVYIMYNSNRDYFVNNCYRNSSEFTTFIIYKYICMYLILHELFHYLFTFKFSQKYLDEAALKGIPYELSHFIANVVEDSTIQRLGLLKYPIPLYQNCFAVCTNLFQGSVSANLYLQQIQSSASITIRDKLMFFIYKYYCQKAVNLKTFIQVSCSILKFSQETLDCFDDCVSINDSEERCKKTILELSPLIFNDLLNASANNNNSPSSSSKGSILDANGISQSKSKESSNDSSNQQSNQESNQQSNSDSNEDSENSHEANKSDSDSGNSKSSSDKQSDSNKDDSDSKDSSNVQSDSNNTNSDSNTNTDSNTDNGSGNNSDSDSDSDSDSNLDSSSKGFGCSLSNKSLDDMTDILKKEIAKAVKNMPILQEDLTNLSKAEDINLDLSNPSISEDFSLIDIRNSDALEHGFPSSFSFLENLTNEIYYQATIDFENIYNSGTIIERDLDYGELDSEDIIPYYTEKRFNIFSNREDFLNDVDIKVTFLIDFSGSMAKPISADLNRYESCFCVTAGLCEALSNIDIETSILLFSDFCFLFKDFNDREVSCSSLIRHLCNSVQVKGTLCCTNLLPALNYFQSTPAYSSSNSSTCNILIILCDGDTDSASSCVAKLESFREQSINILGIYIGTSREVSRGNCGYFNQLFKEDEIILCKDSNVLSLPSLLKEYIINKLLK